MTDVGGDAAAAALAAAGCIEGPPNVHPGQGTACRRFYFVGFYLELLWVTDPGEAGGTLASRLGLLDRWRGRNGQACPIGICTRPAGAHLQPPNAWWPYRPPYLPNGLEIQVAMGSERPEVPSVFHLPMKARPGELPSRSSSESGHRLPERTRARVLCRSEGARYEPCLQLARLGVIELSESDSDGIELEFDHAAGGESVDLRPAAPVRIAW